MKTTRFRILLGLLLRCLIAPATVCAASGHPHIFQRQALALPATFARLAKIRDFGDYLVRQLAGHGQLAWVGNADVPSVSFFKITRNRYKNGNVHANGNGNGSRSKPAALLPLERQSVFSSSADAWRVLDYFKELSFETIAEFGAVFNGVVFDGKTRHVFHALPSETWEEVVKTIEDHLKSSEHKLFSLVQYNRGADVWFAIGSYFEAKFYESDFLPESYHSLRGSA